MIYLAKYSRRESQSRTYHPGGSTAGCGGLDAYQQLTYGYGLGSIVGDGDDAYLEWSSENHMYGGISYHRNGCLTVVQTPEPMEVG